MSRPLFLRLLSLIVFFTILFALPSVAATPVLMQQIVKKDTTLKSFVKRAKSYKELDLIDVVKLILHRRLMARSDSVAKREKLHISILPAPGYTQTTGFLGVVSGNFAFFVNGEHNLNVSNVSMNVSYTQKNQAVFAVQPNIWTINDEWNVIGDNRFIKYPQETYGLGGRTLPSAL